MVRKSAQECVVICDVNAVAELIVYPHCDILRRSMAKLIVREVAEREGMKSALELATKAGIAYASAYRLWLGSPKMIGLDTIERLCRALRVRPGQLFELDGEISLAAAGSKSKAKTRKRR